MDFQARPVELACAVTFRKVQGRTMSKIILDLNHRPGKGMGQVTFEGFYVGMSRGRQSNDIRLLPFRGQKTLARLGGLQPPSALSAWLKRVVLTEDGFVKKFQ